MWANPNTNPFLQRALRLEARRGKPWTTLLFAAGFMLALCALLVFANAHWLEFLAWANIRPRSGPLAFPWPDGHPIAALATITAGVCAYGALFAARLRAAQLLRRELLGNTLENLQLAPIAEERWLWMMSAHPVAVAGLLWLLGLPMYALAVWTNVWTLGDIFGLLLIFLLIGHAIPSWQPRAWTVASATNSVAAAKAYQARLAEVARNEGGMGSSETEHLTRAQRFERERRLQRALNAPLTDASATGKPQSKSSVPLKFWFNAGSARGQVKFPWWLIFYFTFTSFRSWGAMSAWLPEHTADLAAFLPISWPLLGARLLLASWPFFAFALPPGVLLLPLWLLWTQRNLLMLGAQVSSGETFWTPHRAARRHALTLASWGIIVIITVGYGWQSLIESGQLGILLGARPSNADWALAALWTVFLVIGTFAAGRTLEGPFARATFGETEYSRAWIEARRGALIAVGTSLIFYFAFCWLGGRSGTSSAWLARLAPTLLAAFAFLLFDFGGAAMGGRMRGAARKRWQGLRALWYFLPLLVAPLHWATTVYYGWPTDWTHYGYVTISPFGSLLSLFRAQLWPASAGAWLWWCGSFVQIVVGAMCLHFAARGLAEEKPARIGEAIPFWLVPLHSLWRGVLWLGAAIKYFFKRIGAWVNGGNESFIRRFEPLDQPVLLDELRRRVRRGWWPLQWTLIFLLTCALSLLLFAPGQTGYAVSGGVIAPLANAGSTIVQTALYIGFPILFFSTLPQGRAFDQDRANGTLVFLFLTPLSDRAILLGKTLPTLIYCAALFCIMLFWLVVGGMLSAVGDDGTLLLLASSGALAAGATTTASVFLQTAFGVRARKTGEAQSKGLIIGGGALAALFVAGVGIAGLVPGQSNFPLVFSGLFLAAALICSLAVWMAWRWALRSLRARRYGDVEIKM